MSPLVVRELGVHANLEGEFLIQVNFCSRSGDRGSMEENRIVTFVEDEIQAMGVGKQK